MITTYHFRQPVFGCRQLFLHFWVFFGTIIFAVPIFLQLSFTRTDEHPSALALEPDGIWVTVHEGLPFPDVNDVPGDCGHVLQKKTRGSTSALS